MDIDAGDNLVVRLKNLPEDERREALLKLVPYAIKELAPRDSEAYSVSSKLNWNNPLLEISTIKLNLIGQILEQVGLGVEFEFIESRINRNFLISCQLQPKPYVTERTI